MRFLFFFHMTILRYAGIHILLFFSFEYPQILVGSAQNHAVTLPSSSSSFLHYSHFRSAASNDFQYIIFMAMIGTSMADIERQDASPEPANEISVRKTDQSYLEENPDDNTWG